MLLILFFGVPVIEIKAGWISVLVIHNKSFISVEVKDVESLTNNVNLLFSGSINLGKIKNQFQHSYYESYEKKAIKRILFDLVISFAPNL